jgi:hypothetical protein
LILGSVSYDFGVAMQPQQEEAIVNVPPDTTYDGILLG